MVREDADEFYDAWAVCHQCLIVVITDKKTGHPHHCGAEKGVLGVILYFKFPADTASTYDHSAPGTEIILFGFGHRRRNINLTVPDFPDLTGSAIKDFRLLNSGQAEGIIIIQWNAIDSNFSGICLDQTLAAIGIAIVL